MSWAETDLTDDSTGIALERDSTGRDMWVTATCSTGASPNKDGKALDDGLNNAAGEIKKAP